MRKTLCEILNLEGHSTVGCQSPTEAEQAIIESIAKRQPFDIVINNSSQKELPESVATICKIIIADTPSLDEAIYWVKRGATDYITRPIDINRLRCSVQRACEVKTSDTSHPTTQRRHRSPKQTKATKMVGSSSKIEALRHLISKVAPSDARVMILGENGTGKELVARSIHEQSPRANSPFIEVNCAAIPSELIESELFGHEKGAFTSAIKQRQGKFEQANGGTLFLDEIGDMSLAAQAKVLRALQERKICRVGSDRDIDIDVRVIAATNKDIKHEIAQGNFREDLYHRIGVIVIRVATLRDRCEDIPDLVQYFLDEICHDYHIDCKQITNDAITQLSKMSWSGNIRELHNVVERLVVLSEQQIEADDVELYCTY
ncbi:MAG: sigma-54 dependent transcriptional regulator [Rikenellaceae bacterium]